MFSAVFPDEPRYSAAVSQQNVDLASRVFEVFAVRDLDGLLAIVDRDVEFLPVTANITTGGMPYRGHEGIARYLDDVARVWPKLRLFPDELRDLGDTVVVLGRVVAHGGGMILDRPTGWVFRMRDGKIVRMRVYASHAEAVDAAAD
jgi:ketosteroid isomerase-like protein